MGHGQTVLWPIRMLKPLVVLMAVVFVLSPPRPADGSCCECPRPPRFENDCQVTHSFNPLSPFNVHCVTTLGCDDHSPCDPHCGVGDCNIIGCGCQGGCRQPAATQGRSVNLDIEHERTEGLFNAIDSNGDGGIDEKEALAYLWDKLKPEQKKDLSWFRDLDVNNDGHISPHEFDHDLSDE